MSDARKLIHTTRIPVRWGDMDAYGHVNNTIYFRYCEQARVEWSERIGFPVRTGAGEGIVIINAACTFLIPITYPATVIVDMFAGEPGRSSVMAWYELRVAGDDRLFAEGSSKMVWMSQATGKSVPLPEALRAHIQN
jgi:acyl-CoA thioester hydrolase